MIIYSSLFSKETQSQKINSVAQKVLLKAIPILKFLLSSDVMNLFIIDWNSFVCGEDVVSDQSNVQIAQ